MEIPDDPAEHAQDSSWRYADDLEIVAGQVMLEMGLADDQMGLRDPVRRLAHHGFLPHERTGGGVNHVGQVNLDSGLMNPELFGGNYDERALRAWRRARLKDRAQAIIAHDLAEAQYGDHKLALIAAPATERPISLAARNLLREQERGWNGHRLPAHKPFR